MAPAAQPPNHQQPMEPTAEPILKLLPPLQTHALVHGKDSCPGPRTHSPSAHRGVSEEEEEQEEEEVEGEAEERQR